MFFWSSFPFVRLTIPISLGILLSHFLKVELNLLYICIAFLCLYALALLSHFFNKQYQLQWANGVFLFCLLCCLGFSHYSFFKDNVKPPPLVLTSPISWVGKVEFVQRKANNIKSFIVTVKKIEYEGGWKNVNFKLCVYNKDSLLTVYPSDIIGASSILREIEPVKNPFQFDYKNYLANKNIYLISYEDVFTIDSSPNSIYKLGSQLREAVENIYKLLDIGKEELGVLVALTLGDKSQIDSEYKKAFAGAGAMHILAVSGLHVGIVFLLFNTFLQKLPNRRFFVIFRGFLLVGIIWGFALLTGFSPSVQRAGWMFSFVILAPIFRRNINVINSIFLSAFLLLINNPNVLFEVGFQLSYSAVLGIVLIHPIVYRWIVVKNYMLDKLWSLLVVSLAAQLATLPLTLFYFHQFPNYFLLTNIIVIPLAFGIVFCAIIVLFMVAIFGSHFYLGNLLEVQLYGLNYSVSEITKLPYAVSSGLWIHPASLFLIIASIICLIAYLYQINKQYLYGFLSGIFLCLLLETYLDFKQLDKKQITFYASNKGATLSHIVGLKGEVFCVEKDSRTIDRVVEDHLGAMGVELVKLHLIQKTKSNRSLTLGSYSILLSGNNDSFDALCPDIGNYQKQNYFLIPQSSQAAFTFFGINNEPFPSQVSRRLKPKYSFWLEY